jgi:hypothetical protein
VREWEDGERVIECHSLPTKHLLPIEFRTAGTYEMGGEKRGVFDRVGMHGARL